MAARSIATNCARSISRTGSDWAEGEPTRPGLQPDLVLASQSRQRLHAGASRQGHPRFLDRALHRLAPDRRVLRPRTRHAVHHQHLDSRRLQRHAGRSLRAARTAEGFAGQGLRRTDRSAVQPRFDRRQAVRPRRRKATPSARTSSIWAMRSPIRRCSRSTRVTSIPPKPSPIKFRRCCCTCRRFCCTSAAACAGTAITW